MEAFTLWLGKMGTMISDRRLIVLVLAVIFSFVGIPYTTNAIDNQTVAMVVAVIQGVVALVGSMGVIQSWGIRPPSGLKYKEIVAAFLKEDSPEMKILRELLAEAGLDIEV